MQNFSRRYGIKYSGMLIETDNYDVNYPFVWQPDEDIFQYFGRLLLDGEGEIVWDSGHIPISKGGSILVPACFEEFSLSADGTLIAALISPSSHPRGG